MNSDSVMTPVDLQEDLCEEKKHKQFSWFRVAKISLMTFFVVAVPFLYLEYKKEVEKEICSAAKSTSYTNRNKRQSFDLTNTSIPIKEILSGGVRKDAIPALSQPDLVSVNDADYLNDKDRVIGVALANQSRAYPLKILNFHEIVNDEVENLPYAVTYCPLCDSAAVFDKRTSLGQFDFGVSGFLYNSNVLMYNRSEDEENLWSQLNSIGVSGKANNITLEALPFEMTTWKSWKTRYPNTLVLSNATGHSRDYTLNPYATYFANDQLMFPAKPMSDDLPTKERVLGVWLGDKYRAYPLSSFNEKKPRISDKINDKTIILEFLPDANSLRVSQAEEGIKWMYSFWFAWYAMHPETEIYQATP